MSTTRVYDLPTRLFHWLFAGFFLAAFTIANTVDDESWRFSLHMLAGLCAVFVVVLRLAWSAIGTRHARLTDLALHPRQLIDYLKGLRAKEPQRWTGHNPASSWAAVAMVLMMLGLGVTGLLMARGNESLEDVHELLANGLLAVVLLHLAGIALHVLRHRDRLPAAMVTGGKETAPGETPVPARPLAGLGMLALPGLFALYQGNHFDPQARTLQLSGLALQLGEAQHEGERGVILAGEDEEHDDDD